MVKGVDLTMRGCYNRIRSAGRQLDEFWHERYCINKLLKPDRLLLS